MGREALFTKETNASDVTPGSSVQFHEIPCPKKRPWVLEAVHLETCMHVFRVTLLRLDDAQVRTEVTRQARLAFRRYRINVYLRGLHVRRWSTTE